MKSFKSTDAGYDPKIMVKADQSTDTLANFAVLSNNRLVTSYIDNSLLKIWNINENDGTLQFEKEIKIPGNEARNMIELNNGAIACIYHDEEEGHDMIYMRSPNNSSGKFSTNINSNIITPKDNKFLLITGTPFATVFPVFESITKNYQAYKWKLLRIGSMKELIEFNIIGIGDKKIFFQIGSSITCVDFPELYSSKSISLEGKISQEIKDYSAIMVSPNDALIVISENGLKLSVFDEVAFQKNNPLIINLDFPAKLVKTNREGELLLVNSNDSTNSNIVCIYDLTKGEGKLLENILLNSGDNRVIDFELVANDKLFCLYENKDLNLIKIPYKISVDVDNIITNALNDELPKVLNDLTREYFGTFFPTKMQETKSEIKEETKNAEQDDSLKKKQGS